MSQKTGRRNKVIKRVLIGCGVLFAIFCAIGVGFVILILKDAGVKNPNKRTIIDPPYTLIYDHYLDTTLTDENHNFLAFYSYDDNGTGVTMGILSIKQGKVIKEQRLTDFDYTSNKYMQGPRFDSESATFVVLDRYTQECAASYTTTAPDWEFKRGDCDRALVDRVANGDLEVKKPGLPEKSDLRKLGFNWELSPSGIYAADAFDRSYNEVREVPRDINDIRLLSGSGCTIGQIGGLGDQGDPIVTLLGWTNDSGLVVRRSYAPNVKPGIYLIESTTIQDIVKRSGCSS
jgi:hypothetical protein